MTISDHPHYCAYLLRCWAEHSAHPQQPLIWRFSVEDPHSGDPRRFATFEALIAYLVTQLQTASPTARRPRIDPEHEHPV